MDEDLTLLADPGRRASGFAGAGTSHVLVLSREDVPERRIVIGSKPVLMGRAPPCEVLLNDGLISRQHCRVQLEGEYVCATDLGSTNGTFVNGKRISDTVPLRHGDTLQVGSFVFSYERRTARELEEALAAERDRDGASAYVQMLLPKQIGTGPVRANWLYLPCAKLSGNAFGYRYLDSTTFAGYILDVAGAGTEAAMHAVAVMNYLRQPSIPGVALSEPDSVLTGLNEAFRPENHNGLFFSIWYFALDLGARTLRYGSAGAEASFLLLPNGRETLALSTTDPAIGLEPGHQFTIASVDVPSGSTLFLLSDVASETIDRASLSANPRSLHRLIETERSTGVPEPLRLYHAIRQAAGPGGLQGDFSAVAFAID